MVTAMVMDTATAMATETKNKEKSGESRTFFFALRELWVLPIFRAEKL